MTEIPRPVTLVTCDEKRMCDAPSSPCMKRQSIYTEYMIHWSVLRAPFFLYNTHDIFSMGSIHHLLRLRCYWASNMSIYIYISLYLPVSHHGPFLPYPALKVH